MIAPDEITAAAARIAPFIRRTPVLNLEAGAYGAAALSLKLELLQHSGSFKARGAFNSMLAAPVIPAAGVIAASGGNHGAAVAYAARRLGVAAEIFVPTGCPEIKLRRLHEYGASVTEGGAVYAEALAACRTRAAQTGAMPIHAFEDHAVIAGQGTVAREWAEQVSGLDTVLIAVGGGGLIAGIAAWFRGTTRVVGVEPEGAPTLERALAANEPVHVRVSGITVDSLGASTIGTRAFAIARAYVDRVVLVSDGQIADAQRTLWASARVAAEPGGATAFAALLCGAYRPDPDERVGVLVCGGNVDPRTLL